MLKKSIIKLTLLITLISIVPIMNFNIFFRDYKSQEIGSIIYLQNEYQNLKTSALYEEPDIFIDDSDPTRDWSVWAALGKPWFSGGGTKNNPYVIQDVAVTSGTITIRDSNVHFRIEDCEGPIQFYNVTNGKLVNNNCSHYLYYGIRLSDSNDNTISGNFIYRNEEGGLYLENSHNNTIFGNTLIEYGWWINGITLIDSNYNLVESNNANRNSYAGIGGYGNNNTIINNYAERNRYGIAVRGLNNTIVGNTAFNNSNSGIYIHDTSYHNITGNFVDLNGLYGIYLEEASHIIVDDNIGYNNGIAGILFENVNKIIASGNSIYGCGYYFRGGYSYLSSNNIDSSNLVNGKPFYCYVDQQNLNPIDFNNAGQILLFNCSNSLISTLNVSNGTIGLWLINSINNTIESVISSSNTLFGILLSNANNNTAIGCTINYNGNGGILLQGSHNCTITGTIANYNKIFPTVWFDGFGNGITVDKCHNNTISDNTVNYNNISGIYVYFGNDNMISGNTADHNQDFGIYIERGLHNTIFDNSVHENGDYGIYLEYCENNFVEKNIAEFHHTQENGGYSVDQYGILLEHCYFCNVSENEAAENEVGLVLSGSANNLLYKNHLDADLSANIFLSWSSNNTLLENFIESDTPWAGIEFIHSHYNLIEKNELVHGGTALWLQESEYNIVIENYFHELTATAVVLSESSYNLISNNTIRNCYRCFSEGDDCIGNVFENNICEGEGYHPSVVTGYNALIILIIMVLVVSIISLTKTSRHKKIRK